MTSGKCSTLVLGALAALMAISVSTLFFPGLISYDSLNQYSQVIGVIPINNAHPPAMVYAWKFLYKLMPSPGSLLFFHQFIYWIAISILSWSLTSNTKLRLAIFFIVGLWPPLIINSLHLWKDVAMFAAVILASSALLADYRRPSYIWLFISAIAIFYALAVRYNAIIGIPFLTLAWAHRFTSRFATGRKQLVYVFLIASLLAVGVSALTKWIEGPSNNGGLNSIILFDLAAISVSKDRDLFPNGEHRTNGKFLDELKKEFKPEVNSPIGPVVNKIDFGNESLTRYWMKTVRENFSTYLEHRYYVFSRMMWITGPDPYYPYHRGIDENEYGIDFRYLGHALSWDWKHSFDQITHLFIYRPIIYLVLSSIVFLYATFQLLKNFSNFKWFFSSTTSLSGIMMTSALFILSPAADYRYALWMIATAILSSLCVAFLPDTTSCVTKHNIQKLL